MRIANRFSLCAMMILLAASLVSTVRAQQSATVLSGAELTRIVPPGFYFQGLSAATQMRNAAAARLGDKRYVIAGLVDTSGYAADVRAKYEGFFITDSPIRSSPPAKSMRSMPWRVGMRLLGSSNIRMRAIPSAIPTVRCMTRCRRERRTSGHSRCSATSKDEPKP